MKWFWRLWRHVNGTDDVRAEAEANLAAAKRMTTAVEWVGPLSSRISDDEYTDRIARAFRRRHA